METIKELNIKELDQVNGGNVVCIGIGYSSHPEASACYGEGTSTSDSDIGKGASACYYIGIGIGGVIHDKTRH